MLDIKVDKDGEIEFLPYPEILGYGLAEFGLSPTEERNYRIYKAIADRENYYQYNDPTAFGNPQFARLDGILYGMAIGYGVDIVEFTNEIRVYTQGHKLIIRVQRPKRTPWYKEKKKEAIETWKQICK